MIRYLLLSLFPLWPAFACSQSFSAGKNLHQLQQTLYAATPFRQGFILQQPKQHASLPSLLSPIFLPKWAADELPLFCKIEHKMGKRMTVPFKFRLGSVEYVDRLEYPGRWGVE